MNHTHVPCDLHGKCICQKAVPQRLEKELKVISHTTNEADRKKRSEFDHACCIFEKDKDDKRDVKACLSVVEVKMEDSSSPCNGALIADKDTNSEECQHFGSFGRRGAKSKRKHKDKSYPLAVDADVWRKIRAIEYVRRQFEVWRASAIEGPRGLKTAAFMVALILLFGTVGMVIAKRGQHFWTPDAVVACCHLVGP